MSGPGFAILIIHYGSLEDSLACLESVGTSTRWPSRVIVLDNTSTPSAQQRLREMPLPCPLQVLDAGENLGYAAGFNLLFEKALEHKDVEYLLALNNDTLLEKDCLENLLARAAAGHVLSPLILWAGDRESVIQGSGSFDRELMKMDNRFAGLRHTEVEPCAHEVELTDGCCFLLHRNLLQKGFRFDPNYFVYYEDMDFFLRLRSAGARFFTCGDARLYHKEYASTGGRETPSPTRLYYFYRNRLYLARRLHPFPHRWHVYWRIFRLARQKRAELCAQHPRSAAAINRAFVDFFKGRMGRQTL